jgi:DNA repair protein RecO (recombination protein O)
LYEGRGKLTLNDATLLHSFWNVTQDIECYAACCYFAELAACMTDSDEAVPVVPRILLLALYALTEQGRPVPLVKAAFEMRLMAESGFAPDLTVCAVCETPFAAERAVFFSVRAGQAVCSACAERVGGDFIRLYPAVGRALAHILSCDPKRLYAFALSPDPQRQLSALCEQYALYYAERGFDSLKFYHTLVDEPSSAARER